jgi:hypothetical protein
MVNNFLVAGAKERFGSTIGEHGPGMVKPL